MRKDCEQWVPQNLTLENLKLHMEALLKFLTCYTTEGEDFLQPIVTGNESLVCYWTPSKKKASRKTAEEPTPSKFREYPSVRKIIAPVFWDWYGLLLLEFCPQTMAVTTASYFSTIVKL